MSEFHYIQHYSLALQEQVRQLQAQNKLEDYFDSRYPRSHAIQTSKALFVYCNDIKQRYMRNVSALAKVTYDSRLTMQQHAFGLNTSISRVQGGKLIAKKEIRISDLFKKIPEAFFADDRGA